jgi:hypothetical protein
MPQSATINEKGNNMKLIIAIALAATSLNVMADQYVNGYYRSNGTYVQPHHRSDANNTQSDNYSTIGNVNPYTGQAGTHRDTGSYNNPYPSPYGNPYKR